MFLKKILNLVFLPKIVNLKDINYLPSFFLLKLDFDGTPIIAR